jgi:hypothetical protein
MSDILALLMNNSKAAVNFTIQKLRSNHSPQQLSVSNCPFSSSPCLFCSVLSQTFAHHLPKLCCNADNAHPFWYRALIG